MAQLDDLAGLKTLEELVSFRDSAVADRKDIHERFGVQPLDEEARGAFAELTDVIKEADKRIAEVEMRREIVDRAAANPGGHEGPVTRTLGTAPRGERVPHDVYDVGEYRNRARSLDDLNDLYREGARRAVEGMVFPHERADTAATQEHIGKLLDKDTDGSLAQRILHTSSPTYKRAFAKQVAGVGLTPDEERALSLTTTAGGFAVPITLDPTVIPTSNGVVNPIRRVARTETVTGNTWKGVSSAGVTAAYSGEVTEVTDGAPTLAQPTLNVEKAQAFIPFDIEIGQDWGSLQSEMARLLQDAKDQLEATKFVSGLGHGSFEPQGLLVGATAVVSTSVATTLAVGDLYGLEEALPPRFRPGASILANKKQFNRVRAFDTSGGSSLWVQLGQGMPGALLGYPNYEYSEMTSALTSGASIITIGDFSYYLIADRVGLDIELIPHLFGTANNLPTGQRGLYCYWRNSAVVLAWQAFRTLKVT
jgi:HK97 family phage major capsid protein